ncbi:unnamed protein product [Orchesella dallaii]|uniref:ZP domain-containing protein n=1 Tax=Orchesella dallaii TaxID=48710 RepID=A0ABP1RZL5_9HEXA
MGVRKLSASPWSARTSLSLVFLVLLFNSKSSLAKDFYYHPDSMHDESNTMEFVSTSTSTSTRSNEVPIVSTSSSISTPASVVTKDTTVATTLSSTSSALPSSSRPNEIDTEQKQQKAQPPFFTRVACNENEMVVDVLSSSSHLITEAYLQGLKNYPDPSCSPTSMGQSKGQDHHHHMQFKLSLSDLTFYRCGTNLIINKITGTRTYYNRLNVVVLEKDEDETNINKKNTSSSSDVIAPLVTDDENYVYNTQTVLIKCQFANLTAFNHNNRIRRDVLPAGFQEAEVLKLDGVFEGAAPDPMLTMRVKQDGRVIGHELLVQPGTPLTMEVAIDDQASREIYGILMSQMDVTDNAAQDEIIMLNGCSVDPYLFENFRTTDSDQLTAQFKAFKFPDSNYVLFRGTVNVCLESCEPTDCSNGQKGYGRRRRRDLSSSSPSSSEEKSRLYEVQMTTLIRMAKSASDDEDEMNPYILKPHPSQSNNNAMFSLLRKAREPGADQVGYVAANRALSSSQTSPSYAILLFLSFIATSSIVATTLALRS